MFHIYYGDIYFFDLLALGLKKKCAQVRQKLDPILHNKISHK